MCMCVYCPARRLLCRCIRIPSLILSGEVLLAFAMCRQGTGDNCEPFHPAPVPACVFNQQYYAMPAYTGPARLPNPVQPSCTFKGHCHTDQALNRINGTISKAMDEERGMWQVLQRMTIGAADGGHQTYAAFGYSSLSPLPSKIWPHSMGLIYETGALDCEYDPHQPTATGTGSATSACAIVFSVVDLNSGQNILKMDDENGHGALRSAPSHGSSLSEIMRGEWIKQVCVVSTQYPHTSVLGSVPTDVLLPN